ncbi:MAG: FG-GAP-like repeat-containing protein [candidate division WOR-3 bacterium]
MERVLAFDTDHDGKTNLIFDANPPDYNFITIWEYKNYDKHFFETSITSPIQCAPAIYDVGYLDADSLVDMIGNQNAISPYPLYVYESPNFYSHPANIVWQDSGFNGIQGCYITDLDQDSLKEILFSYVRENPPPQEWYICIYENTGDNQYSLVWQDTGNSLEYSVVGDFDSDMNRDFVSIHGILVWECSGNNEYQLVFCDERTPGDDIFSADDMDDNGKPEILVSCVSYFYGHTWLYCYETIGDNNYERFLIDSITNLPYSLWLARSSCGDIDADGRKEIVWSTFNQWHIYKATGEHQYQRIYSSGWSEYTATKISVYDLNGNGYPEIIESWERNGTPFLEGTTIWEIQGVKILQPNYGYILHPGESYQIIWQKFDPPGADSFALFFSSDNGNTYDTIALGIPGGDTTYQWLVPDIISDSCKIMIWAYGPPRPGENRPRGVAWDFGDFKIRPLGIENDAGYRIHDTGLKILQNPVIDGRLKIQYAVPEPSKVKLAIYNVLGQIEQILFDGYKPSGIYEIVNPKSLTGGVYFVKLITDKKIITKKCVILEH